MIVAIFNLEGQAETIRDLTSHPWAGAKVRLMLPENRPNEIRPALGSNNPAISRSSVVFPASVGPSRMLKPLAASSMLVG